MTPQPVRVERRVGQRFSFALPVSLRELESGFESMAFTLDVSSRGLFLSTQEVMREGSELELMFSMPSEITLGESMTVRARGRVLRVMRQDACPRTGDGIQPGDLKIGMAIRLLNFEYLPETSMSAFYRISELHRHTPSHPVAALAH